MLSNVFECVESVVEWEKLSEVLVRSAKYVFGLRENEISNPSVVGDEDHICDLMIKVNEAVNEGNECANRVNARHRMRTREGFAPEKIVRLSGKI